MTDTASPTAGCTIIASNYVAQARVLATSFRAFHPDVPFYVLLADAPAVLPTGPDEPFTLVRLEDLHISHLSSLCFQYTLKELNTAVKPSFLRHLFRDRGHGKVLYLDPDILVLASLDPLFQALDASSALLTPHITQPIPREVLPGDVDVLLVGTYNLGFVGLRSGSDTLRFLGWWEDRLRDGCREDTRNGYFVDQKWMDLAPAFLDGVAVIRDPGCNVAYWNLHERTITQESGIYRVNGQTLSFYHFSGYSPDKPDRLTKYATSHVLQPGSALAQLHEHYGTLLRGTGYDTFKSLPYAFEQKREPQEERQPLLHKRHAWEPYQRWCRFARRMVGDSVFTAIRTFVRREKTAPTTVEQPRFLGDGSRPFGVNVSGYLGAALGVGEAVRGNIRALSVAGIPTAAASIDTVTQRQDFRTQPYRFNVVHVNADQTPVFARNAPPGYFLDRYSIGYWMWETAPFPEKWLPHFAPLQEIWTASTFTAKIFSAVSPVPVTTIPHVITISPVRKKTRKDFGIPEDRFVFLFIFDFASVFERKNPLAIVRALARAFPAGERVTLVIKSLRGDRHPEEMRLLREAMEGLPCIHIDEAMSRQDTDDLIAACDAYVSLHRSEGFGMTIAEAMLLGKPVIATNYGGNTDFLNDRTGFPVHFSEMTLERNHGPYAKGSQWAEPDIEHAAEQMNHVFAHPAEAAAIASEGKTFIETHYSPDAIGARMKERLMMLARYY